MVDGAWIGDPDPDDFCPDGGWGSAKDEARREHDQRFKTQYDGTLLDTISGDVYVRKSTVNRMTKGTNMNPHKFRKPLPSNVPTSYTQHCALCGKGRFEPIHTVTSAKKATK